MNAKKIICLIIAENLGIFSWIFTFASSYRRCIRSTRKIWRLGDRWKTSEDRRKNSLWVLWRSVCCYFWSTLFFVSPFYFFSFFWSSCEGIVVSTLGKMLPLKFLDLSILMILLKMSLLKRWQSYGEKILTVAVEFSDCLDCLCNYL